MDYSDPTMGEQKMAALRLALVDYENRERMPSVGLTPAPRPILTRKDKPPPPISKRAKLRARAKAARKANRRRRQLFVSFWMELHCDTRYSGARPDNILRDICLSHMNENPQVMVVNSAVGVAHGRTRLVREAKRRGWYWCIATGWSCSGCIKYGANSDG